MAVRIPPFFEVFRGFILPDDILEDDYISQSIHKFKKNFFKSLRNYELDTKGNDKIRDDAAFILFLSHKHYCVI